MAVRAPFQLFLPAPVQDILSEVAVLGTTCISVGGRDGFSAVVEVHFSDVSGDRPDWINSNQL